MAASGHLHTKASVAASQTDSALVTAVAGKRIRVHAIMQVGGTTAAAVTYNSKGSGAGTAISGAHVAAASTPVEWPYNPAGWFETNAGEGLTVTTGASTTATTFTIVYAVVS